MKNLQQYFNGFWKLLVGSPGTNSPENRAYNTVCIMVLFLFAVFIPSNILMGFKEPNVFIAIAMAIQCVLYYLSRVKKNYKYGIVVSSLLNYCILGVNFFYNSGSSGPTLLLFFLTFQLLLTFTYRKLHKTWIVLHCVIPILLFFVEYKYPKLIHDNYNNDAASRMADLIFSYLVTIFISFLSTTFLRNIYQKEKKLAQYRAASLTNQKQQLEKSQAQIKAFFESSPICHVLLDCDGKVANFNTASKLFIEEYFGKNVNPGDDFILYISKDYQESFKINYTNALAGQTFKEEVLLGYENRNSLWWSISFIPAIAEDGGSLGVTFNAENISLRKEQEEKIRTKNEILMKIAFIQSHEFRVPVANIQGLLELLEYDAFITDDQYFKSLKEAARQLDAKIFEVVSLTTVLDELKK